MKIIPAIDLIDGKCVRLVNGDYDKKTEYSANPLDIAKDFQSKNSRYLHLVDLDGALSGRVSNEVLVKKIIENTELEVELGGGIRNFKTAKKWLDIGVKRVILGSIAVKNIEIVKELIDFYGSQKIIVGVDALNGLVAINGWREITGIKASSFSYDLQKIGVKEIIYTDISKDGALEGINLKEMQEMISTGVDVVASGGVTSIDDLIKLKEIGCVGAIIGKALYTGHIDLLKANSL
ncbi:MAG: 1-(5-phosphoribosyl)-5-[(5-phosphoribosylamino)methylideneamino]imidazole-4-carboxamide isomerase [Fusobacteriaceae bacterium]|jgi:phosphoribosylformimino-5-aminoimidazole carboxamide ribotide isomerase|nr:1-(5-phosphoribosyl)-5-[(5-phosphoribosylamino)methylideneamino]imidazole-4-carboxamide isomerase [Fusobacteriaceae bacterium]